MITRRLTSDDIAEGRRRLPSENEEREAIQRHMYMHELRETFQRQEDRRRLWRGIRNGLAIGSVLYLVGFAIALILMH